MVAPTGPVCCEEPIAVSLAPEDHNMENRNIFISWSGERSRAVASALAEWIPDVIQYVTTWTSEHNIGAGARWGNELSKQLEASRFGIICLTPENIDRP